MGIQTSAGSRHSCPADQRHAAQPRTIAAAVRRPAQRRTTRRDGPVPRTHSRGLLSDASPQLVVKWWHLFPGGVPAGTRRLLLGKGLRAFTDGLVSIVL